MLKNSLRLCASALALTTAMGAAAHAQEQSTTEVEGLVITGTQIRGVAATGSPQVSVSLEDVKQSGVTQASEAVRLLPQILNLGADETRNSFTGTRGGGSAQDSAANATAVRSVNLRGIGPEATLLLINGRRLPPSGVIKAISDLDLLPTNALSRIEVVADGSSAIYGSDAVAGVVNLITRRPRDGGEIFGRYGYADGMEQHVYGLNFGKTWEGGGAFLAYENNYRSNLSGADRPFASQNRVGHASAECAATVAAVPTFQCDQRQFTAAPGNITIGGVRYALPAGNGVGNSPASIVPGGNRYDEGFNTDLLPEQDRDSAFLTLRQRLSDTIELWYEGVYSYRSFDQAQPPAFFSLAVTNANPWFVAPAAAPAATSGTVDYRFVDDLNPNSDGHERTYINAAGVTWDLPAEWRMEAYVNLGVDNGLQRRQSVLNNDVLRNALASNNPATAFNPFGNGTFNRTNNAALVELIDGERNQFATARTNDYAIKFDGAIFPAPGGAAKLAVGAEYHDNSFRSALYATNVGATGAVTTKFVNNSREITSSFAEMFIPLVSEANVLPFVERLDVSIAARYDDYSDFGDTTNPKVGVTWGVTDGLAFRATYGTAFRAPSLVDGADQILNIFIENALAAPGGATVRGIYKNGGNSGLSPEEATTYTAGFDWISRRFDGLKITGTYYNIEYENLIDLAPRTALTNAAYDSLIWRRPVAPADQTAFDAEVARLFASPDLQNAPVPINTILAIIDGRRQNLGSLEMDGIDLGVAYSFDSPIGDLTIGADISKILSFDRVTAPGLPALDVLDTFGNPVDFRTRATVTWRKGPWAASGFINYVDSYVNTANRNQAVDSFTTLDASVSYEILQDGPLNGLRLILSGQNLFDEEPPVVLNGTVSWDSQVHSPVGRFVSLEVSKKF